MSYLKSQGFSLLELMITVAIVAILAAVALPSYQSYVLQSKRSEGTGELTQIMDLMERYYVNQFPPTYTTNLVTLGFGADPVVTENGYYSISAAVCAGELVTSCVILTATAQAEVVDDGNLTLDSQGNKTRDGNPGWD